MKTLANTLLVLTLFLAGSLLSSGCGSSGTSSRQERTYPVHPATTTQPAATAQPAARTQPAPSAGGRCGPSVASQSYPAEGAVRLDVQTPAQVPLNAPFDYTIKVTNLSDVTVSDVVVTERLPRNFKFQKSDPAARAGDASLIWMLDSLAPKASRDIRISGVAITTDCLMHCATVEFLIPACANTEVVEPRLVLAKTAPKETLLCDPIPVTFVVTNSGTGTIQGVKVMDVLPAGLKTEDGKSEVGFDAGTLAPGQSKQASVRLKAAKTGTYLNRAIASSSSGLKAEAETTTVVREPVLTIVKTGPERLFLGRPITYQITVTNKGDWPAAGTVVQDAIPEGVQAVKPSEGGTVSGGRVVWQLGTLAVNASRSVSITYTPTSAGVLTNTATASAECASAVTASAKTATEGIPAVLLEVIDQADPIEVGAEETYVIVATNQGSATDTNVQITCILEEAQEYVSSGGPTRARIEGRTIRFAPLPSLPAGQKATWRVVVKALQPGDIRFRTIMNTQELGRPVEETEATRQY
ncbi:MAG: DUF11 domain-containing protein [Sedimentisphaerales bacterium]|nr:DUF11 domain-containing protein [Sedimentisphaerales bacterium]